MKKIVAVILIAFFPSVTAFGNFQSTIINRIPIAFLIAAWCGLFLSVLSMKSLSLSNTMLMASVAIAVALTVYLVLHPKPSIEQLSVQGAQDARRDIAHGRYILLDYGFPFGVRPETEQCLLQHGIEVQTVGLDIMPPSELTYYGSYISVMDAAVKSKFSPEVFEQCDAAGCKSRGYCCKSLGY